MSLMSLMFLVALVLFAFAGYAAMRSAYHYGVTVGMAHGADNAAWLCEQYGDRAGFASWVHASEEIWSGVRETGSKFPLSLIPKEAPPESEHIAE